MSDEESQPSSSDLERSQSPTKQLDKGKTSSGKGDKKVSKLIDCLID
jgi:hypothetical protein